MGKIYPIKSHVLFTHAAKILHSHNWPDNVNRNEIAYINESESLFYQPSVQQFLHITWYKHTLPTFR